MSKLRFTPAAAFSRVTRRVCTVARTRPRLPLANPTGGTVPPAVAARSAMEKKLISTAKIETAHAGKYLVQLAKHWSHKFPDLTWNETRANIPFPTGQCVITSKENVLAIALTVPD